MPRFLTSIFFILLSGSTFAQSWEVGGQLGGTGYMGDLNTNNPIILSGVAAGGFVKYNFNPYLSARFGYTFGNITAADSLSANAQFRQRNLSFSTALSEISLMGEFNFLEYVPSVSKNKFTPFIFAGLAYFNYSPTTLYQNVTYSLRPLATEGQANAYALAAWAIPYGAGVKFNFSGRMSLIADVGYRYARTDYLDDVSGNYAEKSGFSNNIARGLSDRSGEQTGNYIGVANTQRGDQRPADTYFFIGLSVSYTFINAKCYY